MHDIDVRNVLRSNVRVEFAYDPSTRFIEELAVNGSRIDLAAINGALHGYEIKSDADTLTRLKSQTQSYAAIFDHITLVVGARHLRDAAEMVPEWWGIIQADEADANVRLVRVRAAKQNPSPDAVALAWLLWREEALAVLESIGCADGVRYRPRKVLANRLAEVLPLSQLQQTVRERLKTREDWRSGPTPFRCGDLSRSSARSAHSQANRHWLLSLGSPDRRH